MGGRLEVTVVASGTTIVERDGEVIASLTPEMVAAAPRMLEALKSLVGDADVGERFDRRIEKACAAIAAAEDTDT